jgi:2-methylcitrate dehydratase PrpD
MGSGLTHSLAEWAASFLPGDAPSSVVERARLQMASVLGATFAGARSELGARVRAAATRWSSSDEEASIIPTGPKTSIQTACYVNAASSVVFDYDDYLFAGHTGHSAVLGSLALGEAAGARGTEVLAAQIVGNELGGRLGAAMLLSPHNGQLWAYIHALIGAAVGGRFRGLDAEGMRHAFSIALATPPYPLAPAFFGPDSKALIAAGPLVEGLRAADLAAAGVTGADDILGDPNGFLAKLTNKPLDFVFGGLGSAWVTDSLTYKLYPGCAYIDTPVDAFASIMEAFANKAGRALIADDVGSVRVEATLFTAGMEQMSAPYRGREALRAVDVNFSAALSLGVLVACGEISPETLSRSSLAQNRDAVLAVADRVTVEQDAALSLAAGGPADVGVDLLGYLSGTNNDAAAQFGRADFSKFEMRFPARVTLVTASGEEFVAEQAIPAGGAGRPLGQLAAGVREKFLRNARPHLGDKAEEVLELILAFDGSPDVGTVVSAITERKANS